MTKKKMDSALNRAQDMFIELVKNTILLYLLFCYLPCTYANYNSYVVNPEFGERPEDLNITTFAGQTSRLPCTVKHLQGKVVSWIRGRDLQVLSTGRVTFSTDLRISVLPGTKGRKHRATRDTSMKWKGGNVRIWRSGHRRKKRHIEESIYNETFVTSPISHLFDISETKSIHRLGKRRNHIIAHPIDKRYVKDVNTFHDYGFWERHSDPYPDYNIDSSTRRRRRYQRKFLKAYNGLQDHKTHQDPLQDHTTHQDYSHHNSQHRKQKQYYREHDTDSDYGRYYSDQGKYIDYGKLLSSIEDDVHQEPTDVVTPNGVPQMGRSQHTRAFYPENMRNSPVPPPLQKDTPIAIYPQTYYTQDGRAKDQSPSPNYVPGVWEPEDYTLQIKFTETGDSGLYICQINTDPKMSQNIHVKVINMKAEIVGSSELYVKDGTPVTLTCRVNHGSTMPGFIFWYRDNSLVDYDHSGGRVQIHTGSDGTSQLHLTKASPSDSANYTCWPSGGAKASVSLNVIIDERQAAMQQGNGAMISSSGNPSWVLLLPTCCCCLVLLFETHMPYYLLLSFTGLVVLALAKTREILQQFHRQFNKASFCKKHILTIISVLIAALVIYVVFIKFRSYTTYTKLSAFILLSILSMVLSLSPLTSPMWASMVPAAGVIYKAPPSAGCVMLSMSSLVFLCGCLLGFM